MAKLALDTPAIPNAEWLARRAAYLEARYAEDLFDTVVAGPAIDAFYKVGEMGPFDERITVESDRLSDVRYIAENALIATPAPDLNAVVWKITHARERWREMDDWPDEWWAAVLGDLKRFARERA